MRMRDLNDGTAREIEQWQKDFGEKKGVFSNEITWLVSTYADIYKPHQEKLMTEQKKRILELAKALDGIGADELTSLSRAAQYNPQDPKGTVFDPRNRQQPFQNVVLDVLKLKNLCDKFSTLHRALYCQRQPSPYLNMANSIALHMKKEWGIMPSKTPDNGAFDRLLRIVIMEIDPAFDRDLRTIRDPAVDAIKKAVEICGDNL